MAHATFVLQALSPRCPKASVMALNPCIGRKPGKREVRVPALLRCKSFIALPHILHKYCVAAQ